MHVDAEHTPIMMARRPPDNSSPECVPNRAGAAAQEPRSSGADPRERLAEGVLIPGLPCGRADVGAEPYVWICEQRHVPQLHRAVGVGAGGRWAQGYLLENTSFIVSVSCASAGFCMAADNVGNIYTYSAK